MNYEEKYKDALERMKSWARGEHPECFTEAQKAAEFIFPELAESEDERIRKKLITYFQDLKGGWFGNISHDDILAWLEKKGDKPKKVSVWKHWKDGIAGSAEGKQIYLIKIGNIYSISSCLGCECDYIELSELDELMREEKQGKSKWSEEDECYMGECISAIATKDGWTFEDKRKAKHWLKSLKERMSKKD